MQTLQIEVEDSIVEKIVEQLKKFNGIKIKNISSTKNSFVQECQVSKKEYQNGQGKTVEDIDRFVDSL